MNIARSILFLFAFLVAGSAFGQDLPTIKEDMTKRLPKIEALWKEGLIGENNQGYLEPRGALNPEQLKLMGEENSDRKQVYTAIAKNTQTTPQAVGQQRAKAIARNAVEGLWLQNEKGEWYKK